MKEMQLDWSMVSLDSETTATTPEQITPAILDLCKSLGEGQPAYVDNAPSRRSKLAQCYLNVRKAGLEEIHGWSIWELPGIFLTAEHHCIGRKKDGTMIDVSPQLLNEKRTLFLPGPTIPDDLLPLPTVYVPLTEHDLIVQMVENKRKMDAILRKELRQTLLWRILFDEATACLNLYLQWRQKCQDEGKEQVKKKRTKKYSK
jgi:hypothetical protein